MLARTQAKVSVVIVTYNSADVLPGLLDSVPAGLSGIAETEVIIVDNASSDASVRVAVEHSVGAQVIPTGRNSGYAAGINVATAQIAPDRHVLVLNPDIRLRPGSVALLLRHFSDPSVGVVVPRITDEDGQLALSLRREPSLLSVWSEALLGGRLAALIRLGEIIGPSALYQKGGAVDWATGAHLLISANARRLVGEWDESFFLYSEEVDYMRRVREHGLSVIYAPEARATHIGGEHKVVPRLYALLTANRIAYYRRNHGAVAATLFHLGVVAGEAMRSGRSAVHRAGLQAAFASAHRPD